jgi:hypothetical protein
LLDGWANLLSTLMSLHITQNNPMKNLIKTDMLNYSSLILLVCAIIWSPVKAESAVPAEKKATTEPKTMQNCQAMHMQKQQMLEDMKVQDAELTGLLAQMNSAPDDKKVGLMAAVVTRMVEQRIAMDARKAKLEEMMMQHMQMGTEATSQDPVSKEMGKK